jgi:Ca2+-binding RTX toxin-like protein
MGLFKFQDFIEGTSNDDIINLVDPPYAFGGYTKTGLGYDVDAGDGNDTVYGTNHNDRLDGGAHNDTLYGNDGDDEIAGGDGNDTLAGGRSHDDLNGGAGDDTVEGNGGNDDIDGGSGNDFLYGDNHLLPAGQGGAAGDDYLFGASGSDTLSGQNGNDTLRGGTDRDVLEGGDGADTFRFMASDLQVVTWEVFPRLYARQNWSQDTIRDFSAAQGDILDVADVLDVSTSFAGGTAQDAIDQHYLYWSQAGSGTMLYVDPNGLAANMGRDLPFALAYLENVLPSQLTAAQFDVIV